MKCLVTGGCGFIGSTLVDKLIKLGYEVVVIDNLSATCHEQFYYNDEAEYYQFDVCDYASTLPLYVDVDYVFHMAAESRIQSTIDNPTLSVMTNSVGTQVVLECSKVNNVKKVIYSSTSSAYGLKNKVPSTEDMLTDCLNPYSATKVSGELMCKVYNELFGLKTIIFRYFNVYGEREPTNGQYAPVVGLFLNKLKNNTPLTIVGDGTQRRDFVHVNDVVNANILAMEKDHNRYGEIFNVGSGTNYSVKDIANLISTNQIFVPKRLGEATETLSDNTKIKNILGWKPTVNIEDYIKQHAYKTVVCIVAGRQRYLELLIPQVLKQEGVDEIHIWRNTANLEDREYINSWQGKDARIQVIQHPLEKNNPTFEYGIKAIGQFFQNCVDPNTVYIRLDDDIIYIEPGLIKHLADIRWKDNEHFLIAPCVINNAISSWLLQENNLLNFNHLRINFDAVDKVGWEDPIFAENLHRYFLSKTLDSFRFSNLSFDPTWFSINCISWLGSDFLKFDGYIPHDEYEEYWLTVTKPTELNKKNLIIGNKLACHFSFYTQRDHLDSTDILEQYRNYINKL